MENWLNDAVSAAELIDFVSGLIKNGKPEEVSQSDWDKIIDMSSQLNNSTKELTDYLSGLMGMVG